jgi:hypothetical protein
LAVTDIDISLHYPVGKNCNPVPSPCLKRHFIDLVIGKYSRLIFSQCALQFSFLLSLTLPDF